MTEFLPHDNKKDSHPLGTLLETVRLKYLKPSKYAVSKVFCLYLLCKINNQRRKKSKKNNVDIQKTQRNTII